MIYVIGRLFWFLLFTAVLAGVAGAAWRSMRSQTRLDALARERDRLLRDLVAAGVENSAGAAPSPELERQLNAHRLRADMAQARAAESDRAAEAARARAEEATGRIAELERALERVGGGNTEELSRLREQVAAHEAQSRQVLDVEAAPTPQHEDESVAQGWRLRYFEQRVRYLEEQARTAAPPLITAVAPADSCADRQMEWRARFAEARANHLEQELRSAPGAPVGSTLDAVPAQDESDARWRVSYLEKRLQHFTVAQAAAAETDNSAELAKWRARYLESRVRHLETQAAAAPAPSAPVVGPPPAPQAVEAAEPEQEEEAPPPLVPAGAEERPPALPAAQNGAPDDLSLIEGVSMLQQLTLNALGIYHFEQIAAWTPANIAWVDQYLRLRGRIVSEHWVEQAERLAHEGPDAIRALEDERV